MAACEVNVATTELQSNCLHSKEDYVMYETDFHESTLNILDLPPEMLLRIFVHIDVRAIFKTVILVCKRFHEILSEKDIWKTLFNLKWQSTKLAKDYEYISSWQDVYFAYDDIKNYWVQKNKWMLDCKKLDGHAAEVDAVHIMPGLNSAVSGSRDGNVIVWDIGGFAHGMEIDAIKETTSLTGHKGWVWSITNDAQKPNEVITGSWDKRVKIWDLGQNGMNAQTYNYHTSAVLTIVAEKGLIYTGSFDKKVRCFDPRSNDIQEISHHKGPVYSLIIDNDLIYSGSQDKTINIYDRRMTSNPVSSIAVGSGVLCMNLSHSQGFRYLRVGSLNGTLHTYDTTDQSFVLLDTYELWESHKVLKLETFHGAVVACASTGYFRAYSPDRGLKLLGNHHEHALDISSVFARNDVLITGADTVCLWKYRSINV